MHLLCGSRSREKSFQDRSRLGLPKLWGARQGNRGLRRKSGGIRRGGAGELPSVKGNREFGSAEGGEVGGNRLRKGQLRLKGGFRGQLDLQMNAKLQLSLGGLGSCSRRIKGT